LVPELPDYQDTIYQNRFALFLGCSKCSSVVENVLGFIFGALKRSNKLSFHELLHHRKSNRHRSHHTMKIQSARIDLRCFRGGPDLRALWRTFRARFWGVSKINIEWAKTLYFHELLHHRKGNRYRCHQIIKIKSTGIYAHCFRGGPALRALWRTFRGEFSRDKVVFSVGPRSTPKINFSRTRE
jgi:hypothetical protein